MSSQVLFWRKRKNWWYGRVRRECLESLKIIASWYFSSGYCFLQKEKQSQQEWIIWLIFKLRFARNRDSLKRPRRKWLCSNPEYGGATWENDELEVPYNANGRFHESSKLRRISGIYFFNWKYGLGQKNRFKSQPKESSFGNANMKTVDCWDKHSMKGKKGRINQKDLKWEVWNSKLSTFAFITFTWCSSRSDHLLFYWN